MPETTSENGEQKVVDYNKVHSWPVVCPMCNSTDLHLVESVGQNFRYKCRQCGKNFGVHMHDWDT